MFWEPIIHDTIIYILVPQNKKEKIMFSSLFTNSYIIGKQKFYLAKQNLISYAQNANAKFNAKALIR